MFFFAIIFAKTPKNKSKFVSCQITEFSMNTIYPQRAKGTHRAEGASLLPTGKNIVSSLL